VSALVDKVLRMSSSPVGRPRSRRLLAARRLSSRGSPRTWTAERSQSRHRRGSAAVGMQTLQDALAHWNRTRDAGKVAMSSQFGYLRFTRGWYPDHPSGDRAALIRAWREYRSRPVEDRAGA